MSKKIGYVVFPLSQNTFIGTAVAEEVKTRTFIHVQADGTLTFVFAQGNDLVVPVVSGMDFTIPEDALSLTSTADVLMS